MRGGRICITLRRCLLTCGIALCAFPAQAANYFISSSQGDDQNAGTSSGQPWRSFERLLQVTLQPGDEVRLKRGDVWRETLIIRQSGNANAPIRYTAYGSGASPVIDGTDTVGGVTHLSGSRYRAVSVKQAEVVVISGVVGRRRESEAMLQNNFDWAWAEGAVTFLAPSQPATIGIATRQFGIVSNLVHDVHVDSIDVRHCWDPVWLYNSAHCRLELMRITDSAGFAGFFLAADTASFGHHNTITDCIVQRQRGSTGSLSFANAGCGIMVYGTGFSDDNVFSNNLIEDSGHEGMGVIDGSRNLFTGNTVHGSASAGIRVVGESCNGNIVERNEVYGNCHGQDDRFGIDLLIVGNNNVVRYNYVHQQLQVPSGEFKSGGIRFDGGDFTSEQNQTSTGNIAHHNVVYDEYIGLNVFNASHVDLINNTVIDCDNFAVAIHAVSNAVPEGNRFLNNMVRMQSGGLVFVNAVAETTIDYNLYGGGPAVHFAASNVFHVFNTWQSMAGFDAHGAHTALLLKDPVALDFRPTELSPAVDAGVDLGFSQDFLGVPLPQGQSVDVGAYELVQQGPPPEGEGTPDGVEEGEAEGTEDGEPEGEGEPDGGNEQDVHHTADRNLDHRIDLSELLRVTQLFAEGGLRCNPFAEDGYDAGILPRDCDPRSDDYAPQDWRIRINELLRVVQLYNAGGYTRDPAGEDGFAPGVS